MENMQRQQAPAHTPSNRQEEKDDEQAMHLPCCLQKSEQHTPSSKDVVSKEINSNCLFIAIDAGGGLEDKPCKHVT
jgi:hypothetical protein